ncbi:hypothetical protein KJY73_20175 [Bowmanella sp. Y26]|nr:hypothetical protein [Bowmanella yangjiangensis]
MSDFNYVYGIDLAKLSFSIHGEERQRKTGILSFALSALLATLVLWWIGLFALKVGWQRKFQANTVSHRLVLSVVRLGKEVRKRANYPIPEQRLHWALQEYSRLVHSLGRPEL